MLRPLKYVMKVFYANENYAKYGVRGMNYFMALVGTAFYKKESLENDILGRKEVNKAINYLLLYMFALAILIVFLGLHYLRYYN
jgi:hypothetical protein